MRYVVLGAGAVGGVVGARLHQAGHEVALITRGAHYSAIAAGGLRLETPDERVTLEIPVFPEPGAVDWSADLVVLLAVKTQDTAEALEALAAAAPCETRIVCMQNAVENERLASRRFRAVYGTIVMVPAEHLEPGRVRAYSVPLSGGIDVGSYPRGVDRTCTQIVTDLSQARFSSLACPDIMRWKHAKLLTNLGNALDALCGPGREEGELDVLICEEGRACLRAAGIDFASEQEEEERWAGLIQWQEVGGRERGGSSTWQSLRRGATSLETDYLNGEISLLGRMYGVPTPANDLVCRLARAAVHDQQEPGVLSPEHLLSRLRAG